MKSRRPWGYWKQEAAKLEVGKPIQIESRVDYLALRYAAGKLGIKIVMREMKVYRLK